MKTSEKLTALRAEMAKRHMDAYVVVTDDFHASEYVGAHFKAREYLSGFTGSAGTLVVLPDSPRCGRTDATFCRLRSS